MWWKLFHRREAQQTARNPGSFDGPTGRRLRAGRVVSDDGVWNSALVAKAHTCGSGIVLAWRLAARRWWLLCGGYVDARDGRLLLWDTLVWPPVWSFARFSVFELELAPL